MIKGESAEHNASFLWRNPKPKSSYDVVIVGGGLHGLATAYYLARNHGITNAAVVERGWLGNGNAVRNTTIIRSNYLWDESAAIYNHALKLWEGWEAELEYEILFDQRGVLNLAHNLSDVREAERRIYSNRLNGVDGEWIDADGVREFCPLVNTSPDIRYPVLGATLQRRGGIARHDAVVFALARACDAYGIDLLQGVEVTGIEAAGGRLQALETTAGRIAAGRVGLACAGHSSLLAEMAGFDLPIQSHPLQALVSEILEQMLNCVVMSNAVHVYVSQAHKGELVMGAGIDSYTSYAQRGSFYVVEEMMIAAMELFPMFSRAHLLRTWAGIVDVCPDASPIISKTPVDGLYVNCGWGTGGFKATPASGWVYADTIANDEPHPLAAPYALERFETGSLIDEHGAAAVAH